MITELRYKADSSDWTDILSYLCREAADEDKRIATKLNRLREEILIIYEKRRNLTDELRSIRGIVVVGKATESVTDTLRNDNAQVAYDLEESEAKAVWYKICSDLEESGVKAVVTVCFLAISALPICDELRRAVSTTDWEPQFILYCQRAMDEDQMLAWQINTLCDTLTDIIERRENFVAELDMLVIKFMPGKMAD
ncbi:hypothetical protein Tco_0919072 [Tanacetum coccineum]